MRSKSAVNIQRHLLSEWRRPKKSVENGRDAPLCALRWDSAIPDGGSFVVLLVEYRNGAGIIYSAQGSHLPLASTRRSTGGRPVMLRPPRPRRRTR